MQFYLFIEGSNEITIDKNLEIIYKENWISENPKPRKIKTIYNLILKKINVGNKLRI